MKYPLLVCLLLPVSALIAQTLAPVWTHHNAAATGSGSYTIPMVLADRQGNAVVCGETYDPGPLIGFITTKYDPLGHILWESKYDGPGQDEIQTAALDSMGNVYVAGAAWELVTGLTRGLLFKYDGATGDTLWSYRYPYQSAPAQTGFRQVLVTEDQQVWVSGGAYAWLSGAWVPIGFVVILDATGQEIKRTELPGGLGGVLTPHGDHYTVWGRNDDHYICWHLDTLGNLLQQYTTPAYPDPSGGEIHVDAKGNLYVGDLYGEHKATKYDPQGNWLWTYAKPFVPHPTDPFYVTARGEGLNTDTAGNLYFSGIYYDGVQRRQYFTAVDTAGQLLWEQQLVLEGIYYSSGSARSIIGNDRYLSLGTYTLDTVNAKTSLYVAVFDKNGYLFSSLLGAPEDRYSSKGLALSGDYLYACGINWIAPVSSKHFLGKYAAPFVYSATKEQTGVRVEGIYPNPAMAMCTVKFYNARSGDQGTVDLLDSQGKLLRSERVRLERGEQQFVLDGLGALPLGVYWVRVSTPYAVFSGKLVKGE